MKENNPIDELFSSKLKDHRIQPSEGAWDKIAQNTVCRRNYSLLRAAAVTVLVGLSSVVFYNTYEADEQINYIPGNQIMEDQNVVVNDPVQKGSNTEPPVDPPKGSSKEKEKPAKKEIQPILKSSSGPGRILVSEELPVVDETSLIAYEEEVILEEDIKLDAAEEKSRPTRVKLKYRIPVTEKTFYATNDSSDQHLTEKPKLKERLFAYANNQLDNLMSGQPMELPRPVKKGNPQLEIDLDELFNN